MSDDDRAFLKKVFDSSWERALAGAPLAPEVQQKILAHQFETQERAYRAQAPHADFSVILLDGEPAGRIYLDRREDEIGLMEMSLLPAFQNQMIGTTLIRQLHNEAQECGKPVVLHVERWNPDARRLYLRLGFQDEKDLGSHWKMMWTPE